MAILELQGVSKSYGALKVTDGVSFSVSEGQALGIIGPNGAGKSTLFNLITGNVRPDAGQVFLRGSNVTALNASQRVRAGIGRSFQIPLPFGSMTVFENLLVAAVYGRGISEHAAADHCAEVLTQTGLKDVANMPSGGLSLLQRKRLEMARALATRPDVLLLDEIAGGLTEAECVSLVATIGGLKARGTTIIWIEHVLHALTAVVDRLLVLDFGKVIAMGDPDEIMVSKEVREIYLGIEA